MLEHLFLAQPGKGAISVMATDSSIKIVDLYPLWNPLRNMNNDRMEFLSKLNSFWENPAIKRIILVPFTSE